MTAALLALVLAYAPPPSASLVRSATLSAEVTPPASPMYRVKISRSAKLDPASDFLWDVSPDDAVAYIDEDDPNSFTFEVPAAAEVEYSVRQIAKPKGGKRETLRIKVKVGKPGPTPPPDPPPGPTDPEYLKMKAAYDSDTPTDAGLRKLNAAVLVNYYRDAAAVCNSSTSATVAEFFAEVNAKAQSERVGVGLPKVRNDVVAPALRAVFPPPTIGTQAVNDLQRKALAAAFTKYAGMLQEAAR